MHPRSTELRAASTKRSIVESARPRPGDPSRGTRHWNVHPAAYRGFSTSKSPPDFN
jgi:hypothetical protein